MEIVNPMMIFTQELFFYIGIFLIKIMSQEIHNQRS